MIDSLLAVLGTTVMGDPLGLWLAFLGLVLFILALDLGVFNRVDHEIGLRESLWYSLFYIVLAVLFGAWVWYGRGSDDGMDYFTAYFVEKSLSLDNLFVISVIFAYFGIPRMYQHRVLFWGVVGVIVLRGILIGAGTAIVHQFDWVLLIFAAFLIFTGFKMVFGKDDDDGGIENSKILKFVQKHLRVSPFMQGHKFFIRERTGLGRGRLVATPLFMALVTIELADLVFAVDSIPAVLAITTEPFVVYTSNIFAVLGLRTLYFAMAAVIHRFHYMKYALSIILVFIGMKAFYAHFFDKVPAALSLSLTLGTLCVGFAFSLFKTREDERKLAQQAAAQMETKT